MICALFLLFEETSDLYCESPFLPGKEKIDEKLGMIKKKTTHSESKLCNTKSKYEIQIQIYEISQNRYY